MTAATKTVTLKVTSRKEAGKKLNVGRKNGLVPAVMYGHKITPALYWVKYIDFEKMYKSAGESTILELAVDGEKNLNVLIHDIQRDPLSSRFTHIDFYQIKMNEEMEADVPLEFVGESEAVKALSGVLLKALDEVKIKCLPKDLPRALTVDISLLKTFDNQIRVEDLVLPAGVKLVDDGEIMIALVNRPRTEEEMAALEEKVEMDVTKVEGVVKAEEATAATTATVDTEKKGGNKEEKKAPKAEGK